MNRIDEESRAREGTGESWHEHARPASAPTSGGIPVAGWGPRPHPGVYLTVFLASTALLTLELSLTRLFSYTVWYHFAYLTISVALLGFGSSGAIVAAFPALAARGGQRALVASLLAAALLTIAAMLLLARFPIEMGDLTTRPLSFSLGLLGYYVLVGAPFLLAGFAVSVPFAAYPRLMGRLYFVDLLGAALGCALVVLAIERVGVPGLIFVAAGLLLGAAATLCLGTSARIGGSLLAASMLVVALSSNLGARVDVHVSQTKRIGVSPGAQASGDGYFAWTPLSRVDASGWQHPTPFAYWGNVGKSKRYHGPLPKVADLTYDGSNGSNIYPFDGSFDNLAMLDHHMLGIPYLIYDQPNVLVIGVGGGIDMINAIKHKARHVTGAELQPTTVFLLKERLRKFTGGFYDRSDVSLVASEGRHFIRKSDQVFDLIQITAVDTFAAQATGAYVLAESYLYTVEALQDYLGHLAPDGMLSMVVGDLLYPETLPPLATRLALIGESALEMNGVAHPEEHVMVLASSDSERFAQNEAILVKKSPFTARDGERILGFVEENGFDVLYAPAALTRGPHQLDGVLGGDDATRQRLLEESWFRIDPIHDQSPFFYNVGKWRNFSSTKSLFFLFPGSFIGQLVLLLMITQSVLLGVVLVVVPLLCGAREGLDAPGVVSYLAYFLALGLGFMFIEISFVQSFVLFLGSPTYALSVTIFSLLLWSGLGSLLSGRFVDQPESALARLRVPLVALVVLYAFFLAHVFETFLHLDLVPRILIAVAAQMPLGLMLGAFMPLGVACVSRAHPRLVPWAWGINGVGSVAGSTLAVLLAMSWSFRVVALAAAALYFTGITLMLRVQAIAQPPPIPGMLDSVAPTTPISGRGSIDEA